MNKFIHKKNNDLEYIQSGILLENKDTIHFFSSKNGGVSTGEFESLNLGMFTKDDNKNVQENFSIICLETSMNKNVA
ncbi:MAG: laccase domain-containing protein, partial [Clostridium sp.]